MTLGAGYKRWNPIWARHTNAHERVKYQFSVEMFDIFNHANPLGATATSDRILFGQCAQARDTRLFQPGLKVYF